MLIISVAIIYLLPLELFAEKLSAFATCYCILMSWKVENFSASSFYLTLMFGNLHYISGNSLPQVSGIYICCWLLLALPLYCLLDICIVHEWTSTPTQQNWLKFLVNCSVLNDDFSVLNSHKSPAWSRFITLNIYRVLLEGGAGIEEMLETSRDCSQVFIRGTGYLRVVQCGLRTASCPLDHWLA